MTLFVHTLWESWQNCIMRSPAMDTSAIRILFAQPCW